MYIIGDMPSDYFSSGIATNSSEWYWAELGLLRHILDQSGTGRRSIEGAVTAALRLVEQIYGPLGQVVAMTRFDRAEDGTIDDLRVVVRVHERWQRKEEQSHLEPVWLYPVGDAIGFGEMAQLLECLAHCQTSGNKSCLIVCPTLAAELRQRREQRARFLI